MRNLLNLTVILFFVIALNLNTFGQQQVGIKVSGGLSRITDSGESNETITTPFVPSGLCGFYYNLILGKKSSLGAELIFSQIEGKEKWETSFVDEYGNSIGHATTLIYRHISYLSLPVYYEYTIKRFAIIGGFQISRALASSGREKNDATINGVHEEKYSYNRKIDHAGNTHYDLGTRAGIIYHLTNKLAIEGTYYYSIGNMHSSVPIVGEWKVQQMTLGLRYALWNKETVQ